MVFFSVIPILLSAIVSISTNRDFMQLNSLVHSNYEYSAIMQKTIKQDNYYQFNAGIYFAVSPYAENRLNVDILMQPVEAEYTDSIDWNAQKLEENEVAISQGIANSNGLEIGDKLYSKHIVDGTLYEYVIAEVLPAVVNVRVSEETEYYDGVIIMGFDKRYVDNITHHSLVFGNEPIDVLASQYSDMPESILYRTDEMLTVFKILVPYVVLFIVLSILNIIGLIIYVTKGVAYNFKRMLRLGFEKEQLNNAYKRIVYGEGLFVLLLSFFVSMVVFSISGITSIHWLLLLIVVFIELIVLLWTATIVNRKLWRI